MKARSATQAGYFYAGTSETLLREIENCFLHRLGPGKCPKVSLNGERKILGLVCPHAGYTYSGPVAAHSYAALADDGSPETAIIIGPNHTGLGSGVSIMTEGLWETPLGKVMIDRDLANKIYRSSNIIDIDEEAHLQEHSLEVQLPFLQYLYRDKVKIVPLCLMMQDLETSREVGEAIARSIKETNTVIIASTDMSHYEPHETAQRKDRKAIETILGLQEEELHRIISNENISMCGYGAVTALIRVASILDANKTTLLSYHTSGEVTEDYHAVVGYTSIKFTE